MQNAHRADVRRNRLDEGGQHRDITTASIPRCRCIRETNNQMNNEINSAMVARQQQGYSHMSRHEQALISRSVTCRQGVELVRDRSKAGIPQPRHVVLVGSQQQAAQVLQAGFGAGAHRSLNIAQHRIRHHPLQSTTKRQRHLCCDAKAVLIRQQPRCSSAPRQPPRASVQYVTQLHRR